MNLVKWMGGGGFAREDECDGRVSRERKAEYLSGQGEHERGKKLDENIKERNSVREG